MTKPRDKNDTVYHRTILLAIFTWLFLLVVSTFAFNDPTVVFLFPYFPVGGILSLVPSFWDSRAYPTIGALWKIASASTLASLAAYAWVRRQRMAISVLLLLTLIAIAMTGLLAFSGLHVSNDYVTLLPPAISWGIVLILSALVLILSHICRYRGAISVGMEVTTFVSTICLVCAAWGWRHPLVKYVGNFREGVACAEASGRWGFVDRQGRWVIRPQFYDAEGFSEGLAEVLVPCSEGRESCRGYINKQGALVFSIPAQRATPFKEGLAAVQIKGKYGYVSLNGSFVISPQFDEAFQFSEGLGLVVSEGLLGYINQNGDLVIPFLFAQAQSFSEGLAAVQVKPDQNGVTSKFGYIDKTGRFHISPKYSYASKFREGVARVQVAGRSEFIDRNGQTLFQTEFEDVNDFSEGLARVRKGKKFGFIDQQGRMVIEFRFDFARDFSEGLAYVGFHDGVQGYVDKVGDFRVPQRSPFDWLTNIRARIQRGVSDIEAASRSGNSSTLNSGLGR